MNNIKFVLLSFVIMAKVSHAQNVRVDSIFFETSQSYRMVKVWLPDNYDSLKSYQTIYCFDGDLLFNILSANVEIYSDQYVAKIPPSIVVGVFFDRRNDDMGINWDHGNLDPTGVAFMRMIEEDLVPMITEKYAVSEYRAIVGHSNSTTFVHFFLRGETPLFRGYLTLSQFQLPTDLDHFSSLKKDLIAAIDMVSITGGLDADYRARSGRMQADLLDSLSISNLEYEHIFLATADHLTMVPQGIPLGLEQLYKDYGRRIGLRELIESSVLEYQKPLEIVDSLIKLRSSKYGVASDYGMEELDLLFDLFVELKDSVGVGIATAKYFELFQDSTEFFYEAQCLEMMGAYHAAEKSYLRHLSYSSYIGYWSYIRLSWLYSGKLNRGKEAINWCGVGLVELGDERFVNEFLEIAEQHPETISGSIDLLKNYEMQTSSKEIIFKVQKALAQLYRTNGDVENADYYDKITD